MTHKTKLHFLVVGVAFLLVAALCIYWLYTHNAQAAAQQLVFNQLSEEWQTEEQELPVSVLPFLNPFNNSSLQAKLETKMPAITRHDVPGLQNMNPDCIGWVSFVGTAVSYPVMYTPRDREYYLHRDIYEDYSSYGTPFLDSDLNGSNAYLYGHSMQDGSMFAPLKQYKDEAFLQAHTLLVFETAEAVLYYEIVAAIHCDMNIDTALFQYADRTGFPAYQEKIREMAGDSNADAITENDRLLTVVTCDKIQSSAGRLLLVARKTN